MNKQRIKTIATIIIAIIIVVSIIVYKNVIYEKEEKNASIEKTKNTEKDILGEDLYNKETIEKEKFKELREKYASKGLVLSGDVFLKESKYVLALKNYLQASRKEKDDENIINKIADTYFLMKKWSSANKYYSKIKTPGIINTNQFLYSIIYSTNLNKKEELEKTIQTISSMQISDEKKFYYINSLSCLKDFSLCKKDFADYFNKPNYEPKLEELKNIKIALENYETLQTEIIDSDNSLYYKNSLMVGVFLKDSLYPIAIILGKQILEDKKYYRPILKIIAQSYFDLGDYDNAKDYLTKYYEISTDDAGVSYMLGIIYQKLNDYLLSNIHFTKALRLGFKDKEDIYRLQIYNAYILEDDVRIVANFNALIKSQEKPHFRDLILATYYNLINKDTKKAIEFTQMGLKLYPEKEDFYGFSGWILLQNNILDKAEIALKKGFKINPKNPLININLARLEKEKGNYLKSRIYFKRSLKLDNGGEISKIAEIELDELKRLENLEKQTSTGINN